MTTNDELVRLRKAFAVSVGPVPEPEACPPSDRIWLAVRGELPPNELREILDHIATCAACAEDWRIAMAFEEESAVAPPVVVHPRSVADRFRPWLAAAAVILMSVVGYRLQGPQPTGPKPIFRSGEGQTVESLVKDAHISRHRFVLAWKSVPEAASYNLTVTEPTTMRVLFHDEGMADTTYTVPESAFVGLKPGTKVFWTVTPVSLDGGRLQVLTSTAYVIDDPVKPAQ